MRPNVIGNVPTECREAVFQNLYASRCNYKQIFICRRSRLTHKCYQIMNMKVVADPGHDCCSAVCHPGIHASSSGQRKLKTSVNSGGVLPQHISTLRGDFPA